MANNIFDAQIRIPWNPSGNQRALASIAPAPAPRRLTSHCIPALKRAQVGCKVKCLLCRSFSAARSL